MPTKFITFLVFAFTVFSSIDANAKCITKEVILAEINNNRRIKKSLPVILDTKLPTKFDRSIDSPRSVKVTNNGVIIYKVIVKVIQPSTKANIAIDFRLDRYVNIDTKPLANGKCKVIVTYGEFFNLAPEG